MTLSDPKPSPLLPPSDAAIEATFQQGIKAHTAGDLDQACRLYGSVLLWRPTHSHALNNLAVALRKLGRPAAAAALYQRAIALTAGDSSVSAWINRGNVLRDMGQFEQSAACYRQALTLSPNNRSAWYGLGLVLRDLKQIDDSIAALETALADSPDDIEAQWDLSHSLLCKGDFRRGFALYESRWQLTGVVRPHYPRPEWDGKAPLAGRTLLLYGEQGFGDVLQFVRFVPLVVAMGAKVILHIRAELVSLIQGQYPGVVAVIARETSPPVTAYHLVAPLLSLPWLLGLEAADVPRAPYIRPPELAVRLPPQADQAALKVGLCWQGSPTHKNDHNRSMPFAALVPLLRFPELALFSLQKGPAANQPAEWGLESLIAILDPHLKSFLETAAMLARLDVVITVDTSVMHLAAAMGKPVWLLLPISHDWRVDSQNSMATWYPTIRVFKQRQHGDWAGVMADVEQALVEQLQSKPL